MATQFNSNPTPSALADKWGTSVTQGLRIGPSAASEGATLPVVESGIYSNSQLQDAQQRMSALDSWGPGVYTGGIFTYRILPTAALESTAAAPNATRGQANVVAQFTLVANLEDTFLELSGDAVPAVAPFNFASFLYNANGTQKLIFDYARCISVVQQSGQTVTFDLNIYGADIYGQNMMETISIASGDTYIVGKKAFGSVSAVYITNFSGALVAGKYVALGTSNSFGLPYALNQTAHILYYSQGDIQMQAAAAGLDVPINAYQEVSASFPINQALIQTPSGYAPIAGAAYLDYLPDTTPAAGANANPIVQDLVLLPYQAGFPLQLFGADTDTATATTGDVRGTVWPQSVYAWSNVEGPWTFDSGFAVAENRDQWCDSDQPFITVTYYIAGADMYQNQIAAKQTALANTYGMPTTMWNTVSPDRNQDGAKGVAQYWEAPPSS